MEIGGTVLVHVAVNRSFLVGTICGNLMMIRILEVDQARSWRAVHRKGQFHACALTPLHRHFSTSDAALASTLYKFYYNDAVSHTRPTPLTQIRFKEATTREHTMRAGSAFAPHRMISERDFPRSTTDINAKPICPQEQKMPKSSTYLQHPATLRHTFGLAAANAVTGCACACLYHRSI